MGRARPRQVAVVPAPLRHPRGGHARHARPLAPLARRPHGRPLPLPGAPPRGGRARPEHGRLVRPADRHDPAVHGDEGQREDRTRPRRPAADHRPLDPHPGGPGPPGGRRRLRPAGRAQLLRHRRRVVQPLAEGGRAGRAGAAAGGAVRHGRQPLALGGRLAPGPGSGDRVLPAQRRARRHGRRRRPPLPRGSAGRSRPTSTSTIRGTR